MRTRGSPGVFSVLPVLAAVWTLCPWAAGGEEIPHRPQPDEGWFDCNGSISDDGNTVAWFHREGWDTRVCLMTFPFDRPPSMIVLEKCTNPWLGQVYWGRELKAGCEPVCLTRFLRQALGKSGAEGK